MTKGAYKRFIKMLNQVIKFFSKDPSRRSIDAKGNCLYLSKETGKKCAVGMFLTEEELRLASSYYGTYDDLLSSCFNEEIPKAFRGIPAALINSMQELHDNTANWTKDGLSKKGIRFAKALKEDAQFMVTE